MKVGEIAIVANLGEMKVYKAAPRDLEAEAGLKPEHVKLDLIDARDYVATHWKLNDIVTDQAGRFKGGSQGRGTFSRGSIGERHTIEEEVEEKVIQQLAKDITDIALAKDTSWYLALPETIYNRIIGKISPEAQKKLVKGIEKDLVKVDKQELVSLF
jgi:hypothetical protein